MFAKLQEKFKAFQQNAQRRSAANRAAFAHRVGGNSSSPKKQPNRTDLPTGTRANPLAPQPGSPSAHRTSTGGATNRPQRTSQVNSSLLSVLHRAATLDNEDDQPRMDDGEKNQAPPAKQVSPNTSKPASANVERVTGTTDKVEKITSNSTSNTTQPSANAPPAVVAAAAADRQADTTNAAKPEIPQGMMQYSAFNRIAADLGLAFQNSSETYDAGAEAKPPAPPATASKTNPTPTAKPPSASSAKGVSAPPMSMPRGRTNSRTSRLSSDVYDYDLMESGDFGVNVEDTQKEKTTNGEDYDDVINMLNAGSSKDGASNGLSTMPRVNRRQNTSAGAQRASVVLPSTAGALKPDFSSGDYNAGYTYMNRPMQTTAINRRRASDESNRKHNDNTSGSADPRREVSYDNFSHFGTATYAPPSAVYAEEHQDSTLDHRDSSASFIGMSKLRRANDLALSQWNYVAMVVKKVAEKKTEVRKSRVQADRVKAPHSSSDAAAQAPFSTIPLERQGSTLSNGSLVFAPEEEVDLPTDDSEVSIYDETGAPLLVPNLSDLYNDLHSNSDTNSDVIEAPSSSSSSSEEDEGEDEGPAVPHRSAETRTTQGSTNSAASMPHVLMNGVLSPPHVAEVTPATRPTAHHVTNNQHHSASPSTQMDPRHRQKLIQQQRQKLLLQQQRMQQVHPAPPPRQGFHNGTPGATFHAAGVVRANRRNSHDVGASPTIMTTTGCTGRPWPQPDIRFGPRLRGVRSRPIDIGALTGVRLEDSTVIRSPNWAALEPQEQRRNYY